MLLKIIGLSVLILSLVACDKGQEATTNEPAKPPAVVAPTPPAPPAPPASPTDKAKEVQGTVDKTTTEQGKAAETPK